MLTLRVFQLDDAISDPLAHSNTFLRLSRKGCSGRSWCAFDNSLTQGCQGSSSLMNKGGLLSKDSKVERESKSFKKKKEEKKKHYCCLVLVWTIAEHGTRKELRNTVLTMSTLCLRCKAASSHAAALPSVCQSCVTDSCEQKDRRASKAERMRDWLNLWSL